MRYERRSSEVHADTLHKFAIITHACSFEPFVSIQVLWLLCTPRGKPPTPGRDLCATFDGMSTTVPQPLSPHYIVLPPRFGPIEP